MLRGSISYGRLALIDYGQLIGPLSRHERVQYARLMVAQDEGDAAQCKRCFDALDFRSVWKATGEVNPPHVCYAIACLHFGPSKRFAEHFHTFRVGGTDPHRTLNSSDQTSAPLY